MQDKEPPTDWIRFAVMVSITVASPLLLIAAIWPYSRYPGMILAEISRATPIGGMIAAAACLFSLFWFLANWEALASKALNRLFRLIKLA